jgi:hypothetical protein
MLSRAPRSSISPIATLAHRPTAAMAAISDALR